MQGSHSVLIMIAPETAVAGCKMLTRGGNYAHLQDDLHVVALTDME